MNNAMVAGYLSRLTLGDLFNRNWFGLILASLLLNDRELQEPVHLDHGFTPVYYADSHVPAPVHFGGGHKGQQSAHFSNL